MSLTAMAEATAVIFTRSMRLLTSAGKAKRTASGSCTCSSCWRRLNASELAASRVTAGTASMPARRASAWNAPLCSEITSTTQANGVIGLALPRLWLISMFSTRKAQYSCTSVGVLRVTSINARAGHFNQRRVEVTAAASSTPTSRLPAMLNRHNHSVVSAPSSSLPLA
ncbi:hypothetical protein D3C79_597470 [compost metagenome]